MKHDASKPEYVVTGNASSTPAIASKIIARFANFPDTQSKSSKPGIHTTGATNMSASRKPTTSKLRGRCDSPATIVATIQYPKFSAR